MYHREIQLVREVEAIQIPSGDPIVLPVGTSVVITQSLGGTYTVATSQGLARITAANADALGDEIGQAEVKKDLKNEKAAAGDYEGAAWEALKGVYDPEIPVDIVNLGLVYDCVVSEGAAEGVGRKVAVKMTLTAPGCGMGPTIAADAEQRLRAVPGIDEAEVELVWDPAWNQDMITEEGRMKLGLM